MSSAVAGIEQYVKRLEEIAEACGEKPKKDEVQKDEFLRHKQKCYQLLEDVRETVVARQQLMKKRSNCYETIQKGHMIRNQLDDLKKLQLRMQELHKKAQGKWSASKKQDELQDRYQVMRLLKRQTDEANELFLSGQVADGGGLRDAGNAVNGHDRAPTASLLGMASDADKRRELSLEEEGVIQDIRKRDQELDQQVADLGSVVERLGDIAGNIGATADRQKIRAEALLSDVEKADGDLKQLNKRVAEVIQYEKNTNFFCQMVLGICLLCCVGFIMQQAGL